MLPILLAFILQSPAPAPQSIDLPVSLNRVREGLARPNRFRFPPPRPRGRPLFRVTVTRPMLLPGNAWDDTSPVPLWIQPSAPPVHFEFLSSITPEEVRSSTTSSCCDAIPVVSAVTRFVGKGIRAAKERRAKREVERLMREAGIKR